MVRAREADPRRGNREKTRHHGGGGLVCDRRCAGDRPESNPGYAGGDERERTDTERIDGRGNGARAVARARDGQRGCGCAIRGAAFAASRQRIGGVTRVVGVAEQRRLCLDQTARPAIGNPEVTAEFIDDGVGVEGEHPGVVSNERAGEDPGRPARKVVLLHALPEIDADPRRGCDLFEGDSAALSFATKSGTELIAVGHEKAIRCSKFSAR